MGRTIFYFSLKDNKLLVYIMALSAMVFWGVSYVWTKIVFDFYQPVTIMLIRLTLATILMYLAVGIRGRLQKIKIHDYKAFLVLSFFSPFCYFLGENYGLLHVSPTIASVVIATIPLFAPIMGFVMFAEKLSPVNIAGFLISFCGICVMILDQNFAFTASPLGLLLLLLAVASALINMVYLKRLTSKYSPLTIIFYQNMLGAFMFLPLFLIFELNSFILIRPSTPAIASLLALAIFGSTLAFLFYTAAVKSIGIARTSIFGNLIPIVTAVSSLILLKETIDAGKLSGMAIVITGLLMTQVSAIKKKSRQKV